jgi:formylglycine-generating enzyme required for sulfatase activity
VAGCGTGLTLDRFFKDNDVSIYGVFGMAGNVREWVSDWYQKNYYCTGASAVGDANCTNSSVAPFADPAIDPTGPTSGNEVGESARRVQKGFHFDFNNTALPWARQLIAGRGRAVPEQKSARVGFRCVRAYSSP